MCESVPDMVARVALVCSSDVWKEKGKYAARRVDEILKGGYDVFVRLRPENFDESTKLTDL